MQAKAEERHHDVDTQKAKVSSLECQLASEKEAQAHTVSTLRMAEDRSKRAEEELRKAGDSLAAHKKELDDTRKSLLATEVTLPPCLCLCL